MWQQRQTTSLDKHANFLLVNKSLIRKKDTHTHTHIKYRECSHKDKNLQTRGHSNNNNNHYYHTKFISLSSLFLLEKYLSFIFKSQLLSHFCLLSLYSFTNSFKNIFFTELLFYILLLFFFCVSFLKKETHFAIIMTETIYFFLKRL